MKTVGNGLILVVLGWFFVCAVVGFLEKRYIDVYDTIKFIIKIPE